MSQHTRVSHPIYGLLPLELEGFDSLAELALDLRWSWSHSTDTVWRQRESMARLTARFSTNRTVREYAEQHYLPAAAAYRDRAANSGASGHRIVEWRRELKERWTRLRFWEVRVRTDAAQHLFEAEVELRGLDAEAVRVELYADGSDGTGPTRQEMTGGQTPARADGRRGTTFRASVPATRPAADFTPRIIPRCAGVSVPLEADGILWQR
jgi:starch phosphorylase